MSDLSAFCQLPTLSELSKPCHVFSHAFRNSMSNSPEPNGITSEHSSLNSPFPTFESSAPVPQDYTSSFSPSAPVPQEYSSLNSPYSTSESSAPPLTQHISTPPLLQHSSSYSPFHLSIGLPLLQPAQSSNVLLNTPSYSTGPLLPQLTLDSSHDEVKPCIKSICYNKGCLANLIKEAKFVHLPTGVLAILINYLGMAEILTKVGYQDNITDIFFCTTKLHCSSVRGG